MMLKMTEAGIVLVAECWVYVQFVCARRWSSLAGYQYHIFVNFRQIMKSTFAAGVSMETWRCREGKNVRQGSMLLVYGM